MASGESQASCGDQWDKEKGIMSRIPMVWEAVGLSAGDREGGRGRGACSGLNWGHSCHRGVRAGRDQVPEVLFDFSLLHT